MRVSQRHCGARAAILERRHRPTGQEERSGGREGPNCSSTHQILSGKRVLIAAHGNSLRALVKYLDNMSEKDILELNIPTGVPLVYELDTNLKPIKHYYLGDPAAVAARIAAVAAQGKAKPK